MKIAIFDMQHFEMVDVLIKIFNQGENRIMLLSNDYLGNKVKATEIPENLEIISSDDFPSVDEYFSNLHQLVNEDIDLWIFNTIDEHYDKLSRLISRINSTVFVTLHNVNTWLKPPFTLNRIALHNYYHRRKITKKVTGFIVLDEMLKTYIRQNKLTNKPVITIPYTCNEINYPLQRQDKLTIAVPGSIARHRRDYELTLSVIEKLYINNVPIRFNFIGNVSGEYGSKIFDRLITLKSKGVDLNHFYDPSSNLLFEKVLQESDLVFLPLNVNTHYEGIPEVYGLTKASGVTFDMMRFQKPGILPAEFLTPESIESSVKSYTSEEDLVNFFTELSSNPELLNKFSQSAIENSRHFNIETVKSSIYQQFNKFDHIAL